MTEGVLGELWGPFSAWERSLEPRPRLEGFYEGFFARFYDRTTFGDLSGAAHYLELAEARGGEILEPFCGSGRILLRLAFHGFRVCGLDSSRDILKLLEVRLSQVPEEIRNRVRFLCADVCEFEPDRAYSLVLAPANSLALLPERESRRRFFCSARRALGDGGALAFDSLLVPEAVIPRIDGRLETVHQEVETGYQVSTFGIRMDERGGRFNILTQCLHSETGPEHHLAAFRFARLDDAELEADLEDAGFRVVGRRDRDDQLMGVPVVRRFFEASPRRVPDYPLWHPHLPRGDGTPPVTVLVAGEGSRVRDREGRWYVDASGGLWSNQCGLGHHRIVDAVQRQVETLACAPLFAMRGNEPAIELSRRLVELAPGALTQVYLTCSGSEAVELSLKVARLYFHLGGEPDRHRIVHLDRSYHGTYYGSMGVTGLHPNRERLGPHVPGLTAIPSPGGHEDSDAASLEALTEVLAKGDVAAFLFEPVLGSAGCVVPSREWFAGVVRACRDGGALLVADEVATGFGRTGRWFACEHFGVRPDVMLLSKGINSGYLPLGAVLFSEQIGRRLVGAGSGIGHGSSGNGHPVCCAAALANLEVLESEELVARAADVGSRFGRSLDRLAARPSVLECRGLGLMRSLELDLDPSVPPAPAVGRLLGALQEQGVLAYPFERGLSFLPALNIQEGELDRVVECLAGCLDRLFAEAS